MVPGKSQEVQATSSPRAAACSRHGYAQGACPDYRRTIGQRSRLAVRGGGTIEGTLRGHTMRGGKPVDVVAVGILKEEFEYGSQSGRIVREHGQQLQVSDEPGEHVHAGPVGHSGVVSESPVSILVPSVFEGERSRRMSRQCKRQGRIRSTRRPRGWGIGCSASSRSADSGKAERREKRRSRGNWEGKATSRKTQARHRACSSGKITRSFRMRCSSRSTRLGSPGLNRARATLRVWNFGGAVSAKVPGFG